jgi:hypothetical protein
VVFASARKSTRNATCRANRGCHFPVNRGFRLVASSKRVRVVCWGFIHLPGEPGSSASRPLAPPTGKVACRVNRGLQPRRRSRPAKLKTPLAARTGVFASAPLAPQKRKQVACRVNRGYHFPVNRGYHFPVNRGCRLVASPKILCRGFTCRANRGLHLEASRPANKKNRVPGEPALSLGASRPGNPKIAGRANRGFRLGAYCPGKRKKSRAA